MLSSLKPFCQKRLVAEYCLSLPEVYADDPFSGRYNKHTAMRHAYSGKSFSFIFIEDGKLYVTVKCAPEDAVKLRHVYKSVTPAVQMNTAARGSWVTVAFGGDVFEHKLYDMILGSYELTKSAERRLGRKEELRKVWGIDVRERFRSYNKADVSEQKV